MEKYTIFLISLIASSIVVAKANFFDSGFGEDFNDISDTPVFQSSLGNRFAGSFDHGSNENPSPFRMNVVSRTRNGKIWGRPTKAITPKPDPESVEKETIKEDKLRKNLGKKPKRGPGSRTFDPSQRFDEYRRFKGPIKP